MIYYYNGILRETWKKNFLHRIITDKYNVEIQLLKTFINKDFGFQNNLNATW